MSIGQQMQFISDSATWQEYRKAHPDARVGFVQDNQSELVLLTLTHQFGQFRGIVRYADDARGLIEIAWLALCEERGIDVL
jgi:hypothetical protein